MVEFDALNNRVRCYAHIINICSSHIVASITSTTKSRPSDLEPPRDDSDDGSDDDDSDDSSDSGNLDDGSDVDDLDDGSDDDSLDDGSDDDGSDNELDGCDANPDRVVDDLSLEGHDVKGNDKLRRWARGIKRNPLSRARKVVHLLRSSDQRRSGFQDFINTGNERGWFTWQDPNKKDKGTSVIEVPQLELLRDVKTRWDSTFLMLERLHLLRPVSSSQ